MSSTPRYLARLAYSDTNWSGPTKDPLVREAGKSYRAEHGFGHEDWLFRNDWTIGEWRYGFVQGVNSSRKKLLREKVAFDLRLFTFVAPGVRRYVAEISEVECLDEDQAKDAVAEYKRRGWYEQMRREIRAAGGNVKALDSTRFAPYILNLRFKWRNVHWADSDKPLSASDYVSRIRRYTLCTLDNVRAAHRQRSTRTGVRGSSDLPDTKGGTRHVSERWIECAPEHKKMQKELMRRLRSRFPLVSILREQDGVDVVVKTKDKTLLFEIKSDLNPLSAVREAFGQIVEYAIHPRRDHKQPVYLHIVGRRPLEGDDLKYFDAVKREFFLPIDYWVIEI